MSTYTPGPWTVQENNEVIAPCTEHLECHKTIVFGARTMKGMEELQCSTGAHTEANARLIATAPDLLDALKAIVNGYDGPTVDAATAVSSHIPAARMAIAKAEG